MKVLEKLLNKSRIFCSDPWGYDSENEFLNMGIVIKTILDPVLLLKKLKSIEKKMGGDLRWYNVTKTE